MSITAKQLNKAAIQNKDIDTIVKENLWIIDSKLLQSGLQIGKNTVAHELPVNMNIAGLDKKNAQRVVYSTIMNSLMRRGFDVKILLEDTCTILYVSWTANISPEEVSAMNLIINKNRVSP